MILVTGGAGFIGANFVLDWLAATGEPVVNLDKLTYAGNLGNLAALAGDARHVFVHGDIGDGALVASLLAQHRPRAIVNFAAETHVDRSIHGPAAFIETNVVGTFALLETVRGVLGRAGRARTTRRSASCTCRPTRSTARSGPRDPPFTETTPYAPEQPVLGVEGRLRPSRARLPPHVRPAGADDQLLEQLRTAPVSREADPADDRQRARGQAAAGLRRRRQRARLALRRRPLRGDPRGARARASGRDLQRRRQRRDARTSRSCARSARILGELAARAATTRR